ncbi:MAG TPA: hypothetical protein EYG81_02120 [Archaeoglobus profundus]|nr:hypothetical protein [Archaeoglobus profundus]
MHILRLRDMSSISTLQYLGVLFPNKPSLKENSLDKGLEVFNCYLKIVCNFYIKQPVLSVLYFHI